MSSWGSQATAAGPPGVGGAPPVFGPEYRPDEPDSGEEAAELERQREFARQDAEADRHRSAADLEREARHSRERVNDAVLELRSRLGLDPDAAHAHGPFAPVRRHPYTVVFAAAGTVTAAVIGVAAVRGHRRSEDAIANGAAKHGRAAHHRAAKHTGEWGKGAFDAVAKRMHRRPKSRFRRLMHR